jgi:hypothetical protein
LSFVIVLNYGPVAELPRRLCSIASHAICACVV